MGSGVEVDLVWSGPFFCVYYGSKIRRSTMDDVSIFLIDPGLMTFKKRQRRCGDLCGGVVVWVHTYQTLDPCSQQAFEPNESIDQWVGPVDRPNDTCPSSNTPPIPHPTIPIHTYIHTFTRIPRTRIHTCPSLSACAKVKSAGKGSPSTDSIHCCTSFSVYVFA